MFKKKCTNRTEIIRLHHTMLLSITAKRVPVGRWGVRLRARRRRTRTSVPTLAGRIRRKNSAINLCKLRDGMALDTDKLAIKSWSGGVYGCPVDM